MATAVDRRKPCLSFIIILLLVLSVLLQFAEGYDRRRGYESDHEVDYNSGYGNRGYGAHDHYGQRDYHPKRHCHDDYDRHNSEQHYGRGPKYSPYQEHEYGAYGNAESRHRYENDYEKKEYGPKRRDTGYHRYGSNHKHHFIKDGLDHKSGNNYHHDYDLGDIILPLPKYHYIPKDESPIYPAKEGYGENGGNYGYDNKNDGNSDGYNENEGYGHNAQPSYEQNANQEPNYEQNEPSGHEQPTYEQNNYHDQHVYGNENQNGYNEQNGHDGTDGGYAEPNDNYQGEVPHGGLPDQSHGHQGGHGGNSYEQANNQAQPGVSQGNVNPNGNSEVVQNPPGNDQQVPVGGQQSELHLPDRIPPPIGTQQNPQQPPQGQDHPPGFEPSEQQQTAISNDQIRNNQGQGQGELNNNGVDHKQPPVDQQNQQTGQIPLQPSQNTGFNNQEADPIQNQQESRLPINAQNEQSVTASNQPIQTQQQPNSAQQGQVKEKPTPSHKEPPPPGPIQCADRTPLQEGVTCSAWFNCKLDEETDGSTRPASCWSETGTSADPSFNVFDGVTKACSKATSLHGCGIDEFCAAKGVPGWHLLGGECTRLAYRCGDIVDGVDQSSVEPSLTCPSPSVVDPNERNRCVAEQSVPQCQSLIQNVIPVQ
ncbi:hypothetical protein DdX_01715 [Ditylenchus destructor]|uniref:Uncharacterized protein n=1 Tax=Ditylenchus destructor TaxID=166010 RepID=A0AAD4NHE0_9BILA|nr:hypothetical protein DdX_01715 [Ditylenchus destructor]